MKVLVAHPGKQHSMQTAVALHRNGALLQYITTVYDKKGSLTHTIRPLLKGKNRKKAAGRKSDAIPDELVTQFCEFQGLILLLISRVPGLKKYWGRYNERIVKKFGLKVAKYAIQNKADAVIMYDSTCNYAFEYLEKYAPNIKRILDCSISSRVSNKAIYENDIKLSGDEKIKEEQAYLWAKNGVEPFYKEIRLSDYYLAPSQFVKESLIYAGAEQEKVLMVPYGVGTNFFVERSKQIKSKPLSLLYVGAIIRRKGIHHLLKVISMYTSSDVELYLAGAFSEDYDLYNQYKECHNIHFLGFVTRDKIVQLYEESDCFVLPSLAEGLALVGLEAMATGLPIICSTNTGVNDLVENYKNGIVFDVSDDEALKSCIDWALANRDKLYDMGIAAKETARGYTWDRYYANLYDKVFGCVQRRDTSS